MLLHFFCPTTTAKQRCLSYPFIQAKKQQKLRPIQLIYIFFVQEYTSKNNNNIWLAPSLLPHKNKKQVQQVTLPSIPSPNQQNQLQNITSRSRRQPLQLTHIYPVSQQTTVTTDHPLPHNKTNPSIGLLYPTCLKQPVPTTSPNRNLFLCLPNNTVEATTHHLILRNENFTGLLYFSNLTTTTQPTTTPNRYLPLLLRPAADRGRQRTQQDEDCDRGS